MFITFDGQHGSGKTYNINNILSILSKEGYSVALFKEPSYSQLGILARQSESALNIETSVCLFAADRYQQCQEIKKELEKDKIVICDRYFISALILQNMDGMDFDFIQNVNAKIIIPDLSIVVHAEKNIVTERLKTKNQTRLTEIEMSESFDRYLLFKDEIQKRVGNVVYFSNNSDTDAKIISNYILEKVRLARGDNYENH